MSNITPRTKVTTACNNCKLLKIKCSPGPTCLSCEKRRIECIFVPGKRRGPVKVELKPTVKSQSIAPSVNVIEEKQDVSNEDDNERIYYSILGPRYYNFTDVRLPIVNEIAETNASWSGTTDTTNVKDNLNMSDPGYVFNEQQQLQDPNPLPNNVLTTCVPDNHLFGWYNHQYNDSSNNNIDLIGGNVGTCSSIKGNFD
ncbi:14960_t:CDS:2 [Funneliformis caledonium]|uniref:14960_t:CDS:1 n=1 Tax=Funneliformis caledonium TaxID=1117310 RepID=A0A9N9A7H0_9GLOM|nr:14960_t:CDS:2 [Funneliformis caledonium]